MRNSQENLITNIRKQELGKSEDILIFPIPWNVCNVHNLNGFGLSPKK